MKVSAVRTIIKYRPFASARDFVRSLELGSEKEWRMYAKSGQKPVDIPYHPERVYRENWRGMGDWLGTERVPNRQRLYMPFPELRKYVWSLNLVSLNDWRKYWKEHSRPDKIPYNPDRVYKERWTSWPDFLGSNRTREKAISKHTSAEYWLLILGGILGFETYTPDRSKMYNNEKLGDVATVAVLPKFTGDASLKIISNIDVIWLRDNHPIICWEIEDSSKNFGASLNRFMELRYQQTSFYIVSHKRRSEQLNRQLMRTFYSAIKEKIHFLSFEDLENYYPSAEILRPLRADLLGEEKSGHVMR